MRLVIVDQCHLCFISVTTLNCEQLLGCRTTSISFYRLFIVSQEIFANFVYNLLRIFMCVQRERVVVDLLVIVECLLPSDSK